MPQRHVRPRSIARASVLAAAVLLASCGGDDDTIASSTGTFIDSPVAGLDYAGTASTPAGSTDAAGQFSHAPGETLRFSIGSLVLGSAPGAAVVTPLHITPGATEASDVRVHNKLILLQTLDADGDLNNGIQLTAAIKGVVSAHAASVNFEQPPADFRAALTPMLTALNEAGVFTDTDPRPRTARPAAAALEHFARSTSVRHTVETSAGRVKGFEANADTWQFLGIPYGRPPLGDLRWRPPQPVQPWSGVREAVAWSNQSAQNPTLESIGEGGMSEDSLYLNVTAPKNAAKLPVMVWFHGGAFAILTANSKQYNNPAGLTTKGVVLVTVNHRLGPFGYMAHPLLSAESGYGGSGNYGQMDLVLALQWVKDNIARFGGDPANVTLFGQSGGGGKTYSLMNSPQAVGLFHKAIVQSGANAIPSTGTPQTSLAASESVGAAMFQRLGITTLAEARALPWTAFVQADLDAGIPRETYRPNVDFHYLTKTYQQNMVEGMPSDVPLMAGATSGDYASLRAALPIFMAQRTPTYKANQYVYRFSRVPDGWAAMGLLSAHGGEVPYLFNYPMGMVSNYSLNLVLRPDGTKPPIGDLNGNGVTGTAGDAADVYASMGWGAADTATVDSVLTMWTQFARTGNPSTPALAWPAYTLQSDAFVEIGPGAQPTVRTGLQTAFP
ncbi:carboxylesterase/lipase family protein [Rhizobacter sp. LjRoot28]|uniref:carboxylesterase/lipase family protein n=1 Tax=Rhizobacter sp. LjRoot28 TaxID=3342309 RepID=UPI003ED131E7